MPVGIGVESEQGTKTVFVTVIVTVSNSSDEEVMLELGAAEELFEDDHSAQATVDILTLLREVPVDVELLVISMVSPLYSAVVLVLLVPLVSLVLLSDAPVLDSVPMSTVINEVVPPVVIDEVVVSVVTYKVVIPVLMDEVVVGKVVDGAAVPVLNGEVVVDDAVIISFKVISVANLVLIDEIADAVVVDEVVSVVAEEVAVVPVMGVVDISLLVVVVLDPEIAIVIVLPPASEVVEV